MEPSLKANLPDTTGRPALLVPTAGSSAIAACATQRIEVLRGPPATPSSRNATTVAHPASSVEWAS